MKIFLFFFILFVFAAPSLAQSIAVSPSSLDLTAERGSETKAQFTIFNPSKHDVAYRIKVKNHPDYFTIPSEGQIKEDSEEKIQFLLRIPMDAAIQNSEERIEISFYSENQGALLISPGVSIKVNLRVVEGTDSILPAMESIAFGGRNIAIAAAVLALGGVIVYYVFFDKEPKRKRK
ncbi:mobile sperm domain-containing protein [Candidatus Woesearchaeota archaeon]|nr:mobile sperm domain-containing protein [Candidatus Woesearchaeota archaeon]